MLRYDIAIIGAGPAGIMAAISAAKENSSLSICIIDGNREIGKKLKITGGGRCNITNDCDIADFFDKVVNNEKFLYSSLYSFTNEDLKDFVRSMGIRLATETENDNKVYLKSGNSSELTEALYRKLREEKTDLILGEKVRDIKTEGGYYEIYLDKKSLSADRIIIATGGVSYPKTGSDGSMFRILKEKGYNIVPLKPALIPIKTASSWITENPGISISPAAIKIEVEKNIKDRSIAAKLRKIDKINMTDDIITTHTGLGGPLALKISSYINESPGNVKLLLDLIPDMEKDRLYKMAKSDGRKTVMSNLKGIMPQNLLKAVLSETGRGSGFDFTKDNSSNMSNKDFEKLASNIKSIELKPTGLLKIEAATVTSGGISVKQINSSTMESKINSGMYFAGEMIDVDALTGGFNLQIAFSTGYLAGSSCAKTFDR